MDLQNPLFNGGGVNSIPVTGSGDLYGCQSSRLPHFLDNQLTYDGEVVSLTGHAANTHSVRR